MLLGISCDDDLSVAQTENPLAINQTAQASGAEKQVCRNA